MSNLVTWVEETIKNPTHCVIGNLGWDDERDLVPKDKKGKVLSWQEAREFLNYKFNSGYGSPGCHAIYVWSDDDIFFVSQYDGSTRAESIPRNPIDCNPTMPGGS